MLIIEIESMGTTWVSIQTTITRDNHILNNMRQGRVQLKMLATGMEKA